MTRIYNLFISHSWSYTDAYEKLCNMLDKYPYFHYKNYSIPRDDPIHNAPNMDALYKAIKIQIVPCHIVLIMAGKYATFSKWIQREIIIAGRGFANPKPILAIKPWGNTQVSRFVADKCDNIVGWKSSAIVSAIRELVI